MNIASSVRALRRILWVALLLTVGARAASADGPTWERTCPELAGRDVFDLAVSPSRGRHALAASEIGVYRTLDGGDTWQTFQQGMGEVPVLRLTQHATAPWTVYAATADRLYRWQEGETAWQEITSALPSPGAQISGLAAAPNAHGRVYAVIEGYAHTLLISENGGQTWAQRQGNLAANGWWLTSGEPLGNSLIVADHDPNLLLHARSASLPQILLTGNAGTTWTEVSLPRGGVHALGMTADGAPWPAYAGTHGAGVYARASDADPWTAASTNLPSNGTDVIRSLMVHPADAHLLLVGVDGHGVFRSTNGGAWWEQYGEGLPDEASLGVHAIAWGTGGPVLHWAATSDGIWQTLGTPTYLPVILRQTAP